MESKYHMNTKMRAIYVNVWALTLIAGIVAAVYDCRSSRLSSGFGCKNKSLSSEANEDFTAVASRGIPPQIDQMSRINARPF